MSLVRSFIKKERETKSKQATYTNVNFTKGFMSFLEALEVEKVVNNTTRTRTNTGYMWVDEVQVGGVYVETTDHPLLNGNKTTTLTIKGSKDSLLLVEKAMKAQQVQYDGAPAITDDVYQYHEELHPKLWINVDGEYHLKKEVAEALLDASAEFTAYLKMDDLVIKDIIFTGSCANYNWTDASDIDVHLVVDYKDVEKKYGPLFEEYFEAKRKLWNDLHNITIREIPVEFYVQDANESHYSSGIYSLMKEDWIKKPVHEEPVVDSPAVQKKLTRLMREIDDVVASCNKAAAIEALTTRIHDMRTAGLEKNGEFSTENIVYKQLRNMGYIEKLYDCKYKAFDRELSIEEEEWSMLLK